ncbi:MAG: endonuclease III [Candidatus Absconditicoccaceae bacterium]
MNKRDKIGFIFDYLKQLFPNPQTELNYSTPFQLMIAVILSAQTTDKQVNKVTEKLFQKIYKPQDIVKLGEKKFTDYIKSIGLYKGKAKNILGLSKIMISKEYINTFKNNKSKLVKNIFKKYGYYISDQIVELKQLPGIGEKTAKVIGHVLYNILVIAVDTHVHRVTNRLGLVKTKTPEQTSKLLEKVIPNIYKDSSHHALVLFGRYYCTARKPKCDECKLNIMCKYYKNLN